MFYLVDGLLFEVSNKVLFDSHKNDAKFEEMEHLIGKATEAQQLADIAMTAACHTRSTYRRAGYGG